MHGAMAMGTEPPRFQEDKLLGFAIAALVAADLPEERAGEAAGLLIAADRRGVESHGVARLAGYLGRLRDGLIDPRADITVDRETPSTLALNGNNGLGLLVAPEAMRRCIERAERSGTCMCTVRESNHFGIAGNYARMAADRGLIGLAMTNSSRTVVPLYGKGPMLGTNPIAIAAPTGTGTPFLLDMSTSAVAWGKIEIARRAGLPIPAGWAVDGNGEVTTDARAVRGLLPLGSERITSGHKGYGLGLFVDILCGPLAGNAWSYNIASSMSTQQSAGIGHTFMAWRIDAFRDPSDFLADMDAMLAALRSAEVAPGHAADRVLVPGDPETVAEAINTRLGIPVRRAVLDELRAAVEPLGVPFTLDDGPGQTGQ